LLSNVGEIAMHVWALSRSTNHDVTVDLEAAGLVLEFFRSLDGGVMKTKLLEDHEGRAFHVFGTESPNIPTLEDVGRFIEVAPSFDIESLLPDAV
jgi:hypothetical protein